MQKIVLSLALAMAGMGTAMAQSGVFAYKSYQIKLERNELSGLDDTVGVNVTEGKFSSVDSSMIELTGTDHQYYLGGKFDLKSEYKFKGTAGRSQDFDGVMIADSAFYYSASKTGEAVFESSGYMAATYAGQNLSETITYYDISDYGIPGLSGIKAIQKEVYAYPEVGVKTQTVFDLMNGDPKDSTVCFYLGKNDTATYYYKYSSDDMLFLPSSKRTRFFDSKGNALSVVEYDYDSNTSTYKYSSKTETIEVSDRLAISKTYSWDTNNAWTMIALDSAFSDEKGNQSLEISYSLNDITNKMEYNGRTIYVQSLVFAVSSPVPMAPSNLMVMKSNFRTEASTSYTLTWKDNSYNETKFEIYRKLAGEAEFEQIGKAVANETMYVDGTAEEGKSYVYSVIAVNKSYKSVLSNETGSNPTGIVADANNVLKVEVFPNPTTDKWYVQGLIGAKNVSLTTIEGQVISFGLQSDAIDASNLKNGTYILKVEDANGVARTAKVFKK